MLCGILTRQFFLWEQDASVIWRAVVPSGTFAKLIRVDFFVSTPNFQPIFNSNLTEWLTQQKNEGYVTLAMPSSIWSQDFSGSQPICAYMIQAFLSCYYLLLFKNLLPRKQQEACCMCIETSNVNVLISQCAWLLPQWGSKQLGQERRNSILNSRNILKRNSTWLQRELNGWSLGPRSNPFDWQFCGWMHFYVSFYAQRTKYSIFKCKLVGLKKRLGLTSGPSAI